MSYIKYYLYKKQYSSDGGQTWYDVTPLETVPSGDSIGTYITQAECECQDPQYRTISGTPYCDGYDKWVDVYLQVSCNGTTWETKATTPTLVEAQSEDCGYVPPQYKLVATYAGGSTGGVLCDSSTTLTSGNTRPAGHTYTAMTSAVVGDCVTSIGDYAFFRCYGLTGVTMPSGVTSIGDRVFNDCTGLTSAAIPDSVTSIGEYAFANCTGMTSCTIGNGVTSIGYAAFHDCTNLTNIVIPSGVTSMGWGAFGSCTSLTSVTICDGVTTIGEDAFTSSYNIPSITIPDSVTSIGRNAFHNCTGLTSVNIPSGVTSINNTTFFQCGSLTSITIPNGVTSIGFGAFEQCSGLTSLTIPASVTSIGGQAFWRCSGLTIITVEATTPPDLGSNQSQFSDTNNCPIYVPCESVEEYKSSWSNYSSRIRCTEQYRTTSGTPYCEGYDKYVEVYSQISYDGGITWSTTATTTTLVEHDSPDCGYSPMPSDAKVRLTYYGGKTWEVVYTAVCDSNTTLVSGDTRPAGYTYTAITMAEIGSCITNIGDSTFSGCRSLTSCTIGNDVTSIGEAAFSSCSGLTSIGAAGSGASVEIPDSVTSIEWRAFSGCKSLTSVTIPSNVTSIGGGAFQNCSGLTSCTIGSGVTSIGGGAFSNCSGLTSITVEATSPPTLGNSYVLDNTNDCPIYVPAASVYAYKTAQYWNEYSSRIQAIPTS